MSFFKKLPWVSLILLLLTDLTFGWLFVASTAYWWTWVLAALLVLLIALILTTPLTSLRNCLTNLLQSDNRAFISIVLGALAIVFILRWIELFVRILVLVAAGSLARLDMQTSGYTELQAFLILGIASLAGLSLGIILHLAVAGNLPG